MVGYEVVLETGTQDSYDRYDTLVYYTSMERCELVEQGDPVENPFSYVALSLCLTLHV